MVDFLRASLLAVCQAKGPEGRKNLAQGAQPWVQGAPVSRAPAGRQKAMDACKILPPLAGLGNEGGISLPQGYEAVKKSVFTGFRSGGL